MQTTATSVVSAAVIGGDLILGLGDGSIINCGRVQGPQGLKGDPGPMGATGRPGTDGNTIHTVAGAPDTTLGKDGDFAINTVVWEIYGPRSGGVWGTGTPLRGNKRGERESKDPIFGMGSDNGDGGGRAYNTANLPLAGTGRAHTAPGGNIIPIGNNLVFQSNLNRWIIDSLTALDEALPVSVGDVLPDDGEYQGDLFLKDGILYVYAKEGWIAVGGDASPPVYVGEDEPPGTAQTGELWYCTDEKYLTLFVYTGTTWAVASPPVSLDGIEASISGIEGDLIELHNNVRQVRGDIVLTNQDLQHLAEDQRRQDQQFEAIAEDQARQDHQIVELEEEIEALAPTFDRGKWTFVESDSLGPGEYTMGASVTSGYCIDQFEKCLAEIPGAPNQNEMDPAAIAECNRLAAVCETAKEKGELFMADWAHAAFLHFHKTDVDGKDHTFEDCKVGQYIDLFDQQDDNYALFEVTEAPTKEGDVYKIGVSPIQHQGEASGVVRVKIFEMAAADPTEYVRKSGDTITGFVKIKPGEGGKGALYVIGGPEAVSNQIIFKVGDKAETSNLYVTESGKVGVRDDYSVVSSNTLTNKEYVDKAIADAIKNIQFPTVAEPGPAQLCWEYRKPGSGKGPADGTFWKDSSHFRISMKTHNGVNLAYQYPTTRDEWWCPGGEKYGARFLMTVWKKYDSGWTMYDHIECDKTRWVISTDGIKHFQFRRTWSSHGKTFSTGFIYYITVGGFF